MRRFAYPPCLARSAFGIGSGFFYPPCLERSAFGVGVCGGFVYPPCLARSVFGAGVCGGFVYPPRLARTERAAVSIIHLVWCWSRFVFGVGFLRPSCAAVSFVRRVWFWSFALVLVVLRLRWFRFARRLVLVDTGRKLGNSRNKLAIV